MIVRSHISNLHYFAGRQCLWVASELACELQVTSYSKTTHVALLSIRCPFVFIYFCHSAFSIQNLFFAFFLFFIDPVIVVGCLGEGMDHSGRHSAWRFFCPARDGRPAASLADGCQRDPAKLEICKQMLGHMQALQAVSLQAVSSCAGWTYANNFESTSFLVL